MVRIASNTAARSRCPIATEMNEPMPGRVTAVPPTVKASAATSMNQPPDMDIMVFHTSPGMA